MAEPKETGDGRSAVPCAVVSVPASVRLGWRVAASAVSADGTRERLRLRVGRAFRWVGGPRSKADRRAKPAAFTGFSCWWQNSVVPHGRVDHAGEGRVSNGFLVRYRPNAPERSTKRGKDGWLHPTLLQYNMSTLVYKANKLIKPSYIKPDNIYT